MRGHRLTAETVAEMTRDPLGHPPRVDKNQRRPVRADERGQTIVVFLPDLVRHHCLERRSRHLYREVHRAAMSLVNHLARGASGQELRDLVDRLLRRRETDAQQRPPGDLPEPLERQRQVRAAPRPDDRVDLVDDDRADGAEHLAAALRGQQQIERLRRGHQNVRRRADHRRAFGRRGIARADRRRDVRDRHPALHPEPADRRKPRGPHPAGGIRALRGSARRSPRGTRRASCPIRWGRQSACAGRRGSTSSRAPAQRSDHRGSW